ncbi:MAG: hypothetical protein HQ481_11740 [Alphaproteobacteria bacterium]|nr:hypothetical protein [Alphaproteobacteria bacterium]
MAPAAPVRAGVVSDAIEAVADWVSGVESAVSSWFSKTWADIKVLDRDEAAAIAVRRTALENPAQLAAMADQVGFKLTEYRIDQLEQRVVVLEFIYDRVVDSETRLSLWREILQVENTPLRPELELMRVLLDASDWRQIEGGSGYVMAGVEIEAGQRLSTRLIFQAQGDAQ